MFQGKHEVIIHFLPSLLSAVCLPDDPEGNAKLMLSILDCLPRANRATLVFLLDHLSLVVSASERNKMTAQALATVMGPVLMLHSIAPNPNEELDHTQPIAVLKYLLQIWPHPPTGHGPNSGHAIGGIGNSQTLPPKQLHGNTATGSLSGNVRYHVYITGCIRVQSKSSVSLSLPFSCILSCSLI